MQKISRIYVGGYGIDMAWYDGVTFDLTDPATGEPTDTILNLENGGGKTTLLSFVFSCFDTPVERFLKHIQNKNHRFSQYFSRDGQPGIILIEWVMPPRVAGGKPYYLVIGQAVAVKTGIERDEVERIFFSFEANSALGFQSVPAPKLNYAPVSNMLELSRWIHDAHKLSSDFFQTRVQHDWQQHLREERLIDIDMLKLQVNFSAQEGGIDTGFLNFNSEPEFIRKFFGLTLDDGMAASVRQSVVDVCDKLRRKPHLQKCLTELSRLRTTLLAFKDAALLYSIASDEQDKTRHLGARVKKGLDMLANKFRLEEKEALVKQEEKSKLAIEQTNLSKKYTAEITTLKLLQLTRTLEAIIERKYAAEIAADTARDTLFRVNAAKAHSEIAALEKRLVELGNNSIAAREQLEPWKDKVEVQGMLLRNALLLAENELHTQLNNVLTTENQAEASLKNIEQQLKDLETAARSLSSEEAALTNAEEAYWSSLNQLINENIIKEGESTSEALARYENIAIEQLKLEEKYNLDAITLKTQGQEARSNANKAQVHAVTIAADLPQLQKFVAEGESEREKFEQNPILRQVADADTANPDSPILLPELERFILAEERSVAQCEVQLSTLHASRSAITQTGVAGDSCDVNKVVASLHAKGVKSAKPYNIYLADAIPDASTARAIVLSNPSRFLGVSVASSELESAREITAQNLQLDTPVMVSVNSLEPDTLEANRFVLSADNDAAFNQEAAQELLQQLDERIANIDSLRNAHASRLKEALGIKEQLLAYEKRFGGEILARARIDIERLQQESEAALIQSAIYEEQAKEYEQQAEIAMRAKNSCSKAAHTADMHQKTISRFSTQHDASRPARLIRLRCIPSVRLEQDMQRVELTTEQTNVTETKLEAFKLKVELEAKAKERQNERLAVTY
ncbi:hypothetical protein [Chitinibacter tainanensis]|uniref:hypothetical protein n=1 Tax=Chitinibacter tainanensis TaxID=230667 RepID=UPI00235555A5|nr:hypothetical protein [Chitinibacter tainanensis]